MHLSMDAMFTSMYEGILRQATQSSNISNDRRTAPTSYVRDEIPIGDRQQSPYTLSTVIDSKNILLTLWSFITISRVLLVLLAWFNLKNIPFIWTVCFLCRCDFCEANKTVQLRIINAFRFCTKTMRPKTTLTSAHLFQPLITSSKPPLTEIDIYMHSEFNILTKTKISWLTTCFTRIELNVLFGLGYSANTSDLYTLLKWHRTYSGWHFCHQQGRLEEAIFRGRTWCSVMQL